MHVTRKAGLIYTTTAWNEGRKRPLPLPKLRWKTKIERGVALSKLKNEKRAVGGFACLHSPEGRGKHMYCCEGARDRKVLRGLKE